MHLVALDHIQIAMPPDGEAQARHFYGRLPGLTEIEKPAPLQANGGCWFSGPGIEVHLGIEAEFKPAQKAHPAFRVANLVDFRAVLVAAGVTIKEDHQVPQVRRFHAYDPFGNRLEFIQEGDSFR